MDATPILELLDKYFGNHDGSPKSRSSKDISNGGGSQAFQITMYKAEKGDPQAQCDIAMCYATGQGVPRDESQAIKWYRKSADQNYGKAQYNLGLIYAHGLGVSIDAFEAINWYRKSAETNFAKAQFAYGMAYVRGFGVKKDLVQAFAWFTLANSNRDNDARKALARIERQMSLEQKSEATDLAKKIFDKFKGKLSDSDFH